MRVDNRIKNILVVLLLVLSIFSGLIATVPEEASANLGSWWNASWDYRQKLTFDNDDSENLTYFPVLVNLSSTNFDFNHANSDGSDIRFIDDDGSTELNYEIEYWNSTEQDAQIWVNVTQIDNSSTDFIWMYYGNSGASDNQDMHGTWHSSFKMVQHLQEYNATETAIHNDSTSYNNNGIPHNFDGTASSTQNATGQIDGADIFDGSNDYVDCGNDTSLDMSLPFAIEVWLKWNGVGSGILVSKSPTGQLKALNYYMQIFNSNIYIGFGDGTNYRYFGTTETIDTNWYHIGAVLVSATDIKIYVNGVSWSGTYAGTATTPATNVADMLIGLIPTENYFGGTIDEVRISNISRSANWINATYRNGIGTFVTFGGEQGGYLPHVLDVQCEGDYDAGQDITIFVQALNTTGEPFTLTPPCSIAIFSSSVAVVDSGLMSSVSSYDGMYSYTYSIPAVATEGTYFVRVTMENVTKVIVGSGSFHVAGWAGTIEDIYTYIQSKWDGYDASDLITYLINVDANLTSVYTLLQLVDGNLTDVYNLLVLTDGNLTTTYTLLQSVDGNISTIYTLLQQMDGNLTNVYNLLSLADGNITSIYNLLQIVNSTTSNVNSTVNTIYTLLQSMDGNVTNMYNLMVSMDGNLTATYNLLVMVNQTITNINATLNNANSTLDYLRNTVWAGLVANDIYKQAKDANETIQWILDNCWDGNNISDILDKWGAYAAADLYSISNQTKNICDYINLTHWGSVVASDLDKWGVYTATNLYSVSNQTKAIATYLNGTVWGGYIAQDLWIEANWANRTSAYINGTRWNGFNSSDLYIVSNATKIIAQYINYTCSRIHENTTRINQSVQQLLNGFRVVLTDYGEVLAGKKYRCQITVSNMTGSMVDADAAPTVSLYDPVLNAVVAGIAMTHEETGRYSYAYTTTAGQPDGEWTTITSTTVNGETVKNIEYWELEASPAEVKISVVDNTIPSIVGRINITNEGSSGYEYQYRWWITDVSDGQYGEPSMVDSGSSSKFINAGESFITDKTLTVAATGTYWYKVEVFWGTEISGASKQFNAVIPPAPPPCRPGPPGIPAPPAPPAPPPAPPYIAPIPPPGIPTFLWMLIIIAPIGSVFLILFLYYRKKEEEERRR